MEDEKLDELFESTLTRRKLVARGAQTGAVLSLGSLLGAGRAFAAADATTGTVRWISPRGTLEVMDDYNCWVPIKMGYFKRLGVNVKMIGGPLGDALAAAKFVGQNQADMGYPSPGVLTTSIDAGVPVISVWEMIPGQVFNFAVKKGSPIKSPKQLAGKRISLGSAGWRVIVDPILVEVGVRPSSVRYVTAGAQWAQAVAQNKADAALSWEGLRAQWKGQGLEFDYLIGTTFSKMPSNSYVIRRDELEDAAKRDLYLRFLRGVVMGFEFARANARAAAQITYRQFPGLKKQMTPQLAVDSLIELAAGYGLSNRRGNGWSFHYRAGWDKYLQIISDLDQTKKRLSVNDVITNELVGPANKTADVARARRDARAFKLDADFAKTRRGTIKI
jgi:NitT/TauT family transport system substrate-binding protein